MKGIYLTEEAKREIEITIDKLNETEDSYSECAGIAQDVYREILSSAIVLPVEESWDKAVPDGIEEDTIFDFIQDKYLSGVIIQPKQLPCLSKT